MRLSHAQIDAVGTELQRAERAKAAAVEEQAILREQLRLAELRVTAERERATAATTKAVAPQPGEMTSLLEGLNQGFDKLGGQLGALN